MNTNCLDDPTVVPLDGRSLLALRFLIDLSVSLSVILGNGFIVAAIFLFRHRTRHALLRVSNVSNRFVLNLAMADLLVGLCAVYCLTPYYVCSVARRMDVHRSLCVLRFVMPIFSAMTSVSALGAISVDRYIAIVHSLRYRTFMCKRRATVILCLPWLFSGAASFSLLFWNHYEAERGACTDRVVPALFVCSIGVPHSFLVLVLVGLVHVRIRREVLLSRVRRKSMEWGQSQSGGAPGAGSAAAAAAGLALSRGASFSEDARKSARVLIMVVGCFSATYTPMCVLFTSRMAGLRSEALDLAFSLSFTLANVNSLLNPFIYSWQNITVRTAIKRLLASFRRAGPASSGRPAATTATTSSSSAGRAEPAAARLPAPLAAGCAAGAPSSQAPPSQPGVDVLV
ncbi:Beta-2 adrenergic receptor [Frankliniella fusca]|uniref:Beta-2 adrenergic receptor n=1 Tax=Frankliniella fusca TaxID=407009 RepID=A0AAE1LP66_9NEOP|nr:Beta-2 adrenergic receptor [Frankliniella fusca]